MDKSRVSIVLLLALSTLLFSLNRGNVSAKDLTEHLFCSWEGFEPDKCASIWLIKMFVDKEARFLFVERGEFIEKGIPFDTPDAELRHYSNISAFESIVKKNNIKDKAVCKILISVQIPGIEEKLHPLFQSVIPANTSF